MSDNKAATPAENKTDANVKPELTEEEKKKSFDSLPAAMREAIEKLNVEIAEHNKKVDAVKAAESKDPVLIKSEIFEQRHTENKELNRLRKEYDKIQAQLEGIVKEAYDVIDKSGLMPKNLSEAELEKLKSEITESTKTIRDQTAAFVQFETLMGYVLIPHIDEVKTRRGTRSTSTSSEGTKRIRLKRILINGTDTDDKGNTVYGTVNGEPKYTFTFAAMYLNKRLKGTGAPSITAKDLTDKYLEGIDENNLPEKHKFTLPVSYKDNNGNEQTVNYEITAER